MSDEPIRVGVIRCDTHGLWYGPFQQSHATGELTRVIDDPILSPANTCHA